MSRLFYVSSNVYCFYSRESFGLHLELVQCTKKTVFDSHLGELVDLAPGSLIVTCVLGNFISDACHGLEAAEVTLFANQQITAHVEALADLIKDRPDVFAFVVPRSAAMFQVCLFWEERKRIIRKCNLKYSSLLALCH